MDLYQVLKTDHDKQRDLAEKLMNTSGASDERKRLWEEFKPEAVAHANAEEQTLYAALIEDPESQEQARHSVAEHKEADDLIEELSELDMGSGGWIHKFAKLKEELEHHIEEEEKDVFAKAKKVIAADEATRLAKVFKDRKGAELSA